MSKYKYLVVVAVRAGFDSNDHVVWFNDETDARAFANEEVKWESTRRVVCRRLGINLDGDFA